MSLRRRLVIGIAVLVVAAAGLRLALPELIRWAVTARVHAMTGRTATLDAVDVALLRGRISLRGFRLADRASSRSPSSTASTSTCVCRRSSAATSGCASWSSGTPPSG
jgi:hypothetical protein